MIKKNITVQNRLGMHARPAAMFVQTAAKFDSEITVSKDDVEVNGKSVMGMMMLAAEQGSTLTVSASGSDEAAAIEALQKLFNSKFDED